MFSAIDYIEFDQRNTVSREVRSVLTLSLVVGA